MTRQATRLTVAAAEGLYDNRLGYGSGRSPYAPRPFWAALGIALQRDMRWLRETLPDPDEVELERAATMLLIEDYERRLAAATMLPRDYGDVEWPWDGDPNWAAPREGATSNPGDGLNWRVACRACGRIFGPGEKLDRVAEHWRVEHEPGLAAGDPRAQADMVWVGLGAPPTLVAAG